MDYKEAFGRRLHHLCIARNLSQDQLATAIGAPDSLTINRWEQGRHFPNPYYRQRLCDYFNLSTQELFKEYWETITQHTKPREGDDECVSHFHPNQPLPGKDEFFGRAKEQKTLLDRLKNRSPTSLVGKRRIGKSWLLQCLSYVLSEQIEQKYIFGYIDATEASCRTMNGLVDSILMALHISLANFVALRDPVLRLENAVKQSHDGFIPVLAIDEFEGICAISDFDVGLLYEMRALAGNGRLCLVTASRHPLRQVLKGKLDSTSPFFNIFQECSLGPFHRKEAEHFAATKSLQASFFPRDQQFLLHYAQAQDEGEVWYPLDLQQVGWHIEIDKCLGEYQPDASSYWQRFKPDPHHDG